MLLVMWWPVMHCSHRTCCHEVGGIAGDLGGGGMDVGVVVVVMGGGGDAAGVVVACDALLTQDVLPRGGPEHQAVMG
jgi:hypothetical protein